MYTCLNFTITNRNVLRPIVVTWRGCDGATRSQSLRRRGSMTVCALNGSVTSTFRNFATITRNCQCFNYQVTNTSIFYQTFEHVNCNGFTTTTGIGPNETVSLCMCRPCFLPNQTNVNFTLVQGQPCVNGLPATPTPSTTPTVTPTPLPCSSGITADAGFWFYYDCCGNYVSGISANTVICMNPNFANSGVIPIYSACSQTCVTPTPTKTKTSTPTPTQTPTDPYTGTTQTPTTSPTPTTTPSATTTSTPTVTSTPTNTITPSATTTSTPTVTSTPTNTPSQSATTTPTPTNTLTPSATTTPTETVTPTPTNTLTPSATTTPTETVTSTPTPTITDPYTGTTETPTPTATPTPTDPFTGTTQTPTPSPTNTLTPSATTTPTETVTSTPTNTPSQSATTTPTPTVTSTPTPTTPSTGVTVNFGTTQATTCTPDAGTALVYLPPGGTISETTTIYSDAGLTTPYTTNPTANFIVDATAGSTVHNFNRTTGVVGSATITTCP